jgi:predicted ester cyclase
LEPRDVVERFYSAYNAHDTDAMARCYSEWGDFVAPGELTMRGRDQASAFDRRWVGAFPDLHIELRTVMESGQWVVVEGTASGTHAGPLRFFGWDVAPTGRRVVADFAVIYHVEGEEIVSAHLRYDRLSLMRQLGLLGGEVGRAG